MSDPIAELDNLLSDLKSKSKGPSSSSSSSSHSAPSSTYFPTPKPLATKPVHEPSPSYSSPSSYSSSSSSSKGATRITPSNLSLGDQESALFREINNVRRDPSAYADILEKERKPYFEGRNLKKPNSKVTLITEEGVYAVDECIKALASTPALPDFTVSYGLTLAAREAVRDLSSAEDRIDSVKRLHQYGDFEEQAVEIACFSRPPFDAKEAVLRLLIGDGQPLREHRSYILSPSFKVVGVAVRDLPYGHESIVTLINFTRKFVDRAEP